MVQSTNKQYNRNSFFKDATLIIGATCLFVVLDIFIELITKDIRNDRYNNTLTTGDWKDISTASGLACALLIISIFLKNSCKVIASKPFEIKEFISALIPSSVLFGFEILIHFLTDYHNEKDHLAISPREIADSGISTSIFFCILLVIIISKDLRETNNLHSFENPHVLPEEDVLNDGLVISRFGSIQ